jgi:hypothetical protein
MKNLNLSLILMGCSLFHSFQSAQAGVFNIPEFVEQSSWSVGLEPEATFSGGGSFSNTVKFTYGIGSLSNLQLGLGTGTGTRGFRGGATYTFDFIPDLDGQIGAGVAFQMYHYKLKASVGQTEMTVYPYIHNQFSSSGHSGMDPYVALPFGLALTDGTYRTVSQLVVGSYFQTSKNFGINAELGMNLKGSDTYLSGGISYRD